MSRRRKRHQPVELTLAIESLSHECRGIAHHDGKPVFVDGALPGERVRCISMKSSSKYIAARVIEVLEASPERVEPRCEVAGVCGGCSLQHMSQQSQVAYKQQALLDILRQNGNITPQEILPPLVGPAWNYRRKARLGVRVVPQKGGALVGFRERNSSYITVMNRCDVLDERFADLINPLRELVGKLESGSRIPQIEVSAGDETAILVFRHLVPLSATDQNALAEFGKQYALKIMTQPAGPDSILPLFPEKIDLQEYSLEKWDVTVRFRPTDFTQVNARINQMMVERALELLAPEAGEDVLDLFCGLGNFTLPLARTCNHVTGIEADPLLIKMARENAEFNALRNAEFITADLYDEPLDGSWLHRKWDRILLDPPRSGAMEVVKRLPELQPKRIVYVSCNPATLARDSEYLVNHSGFKLLQAGVMDMFPHTRHVESIAVFER